MNQKKIEFLRPKSDIKIITFIMSFILCLSTIQISAQSNLSYGLGIGGNYSKLFLEENETTFIDTYSGQLGLNAIATRLELNLTKKLSTALQPEIVFTSSKDRSEIKTNATYFNAPLIIKYRLLKKFCLNTGIYYQHLIRLNLTQNEDSINFTFFANHRNFFNPSFGLSYFFNENISLEINGIYSTKDLHNGGAEDKNGNIIGPLKTYNHYLSFAIWYQFEIEK